MRRNPAARASSNEHDISRPERFETAVKPDSFMHEIELAQEPRRSLNGYPNRTLVRLRDPLRHTATLCRCRRGCDALAKPRKRAACVGFRVFEVRDPTRTIASPVGLDDKRNPGFMSRPIRIGLWYPASTDGRLTMKFGDYVDPFWLDLRQSTDESTDAERRRARSDFRAYTHAQASPDTFERLLSKTVQAYRNAKPSPAAFRWWSMPVASAASRHAHSLTCEYLASHGYVVACSPSEGASSLGMTFDADGQERRCATWNSRSLECSNRPRSATSRSVSLA